MSSAEPPDELAGLLAAPELRAHLIKRATEFIDVVFDEALVALEDGDTATRASFMKMILPQLLKAQKEADDRGATAEQTNEKTRDLFAEMREALKS